MKFFLSVLLLAIATLGPVSHAALNNANNPQTAIVDLGSITADGDVYGVYCHKKCRIVSAKIANVGTIAASDTDFFTVSLKNGSTEIAELDTRAAHENGLTTLVPKALNVVSSTVSLVAAGSWLKVAYDESGTMALTSAKLIVVYYLL